MVETKDCMIKDCNNRIPEDYPSNANFCEEHTCTYTEFDHNKNLVRCYDNKVSPSAEACYKHLCKFEGCDKSCILYNSIYRPINYCHEHNKYRKMSMSQRLCIILIAIGIYACYLYFFMQLKYCTK